MDPGDEGLLALLATDLKRYYERLMSIYWYQLEAFVLRRTGSVQDTEDIVQEAFVRAYFALERYPAQRVQTLKIRPWLYKITWNVYCNYAGRSKLPASISLDTSEESLLLEQEDDWREQPEVVLENAERRRELESLVDTLPDIFRELVRMYYFDGLSQQEIAAILHQPVGTVKVYVHRGVRLLRKTLAVQANEVESNNGA